MPEYIVRENGYPGQIKQEVVGELVRCKDCWKRNDEDFCPMVSNKCYPPELTDDFFCAGGEREIPDDFVWPAAKGETMSDDLISRKALLKAMDTWDKFGFVQGAFVREPENDDYIPYVHYADMVKCVEGMPPAQPEGRKANE